MSEKLYAVVPDFGKIDMFARDKNEEVAYFKFKDQAMAFANKMWPGCHEIKEVIGEFTPHNPIVRNLEVVLLRDITNGMVFPSIKNSEWKESKSYPIIASSKVTLVEGEYV